MKKIDEDKKYYKVVEQRATDTNRPLYSFQAPGIPDGIYSSDVLYEWQNVGFKELSHRTGIPLQHDYICICDQCLNDMDIKPITTNSKEGKPISKGALIIGKISLAEDSFHIEPSPLPIASENVYLTDKVDISQSADIHDFYCTEKAIASASIENQTTVEQAAKIRLHWNYSDEDNAYANGFVGGSAFGAHWQSQITQQPLIELLEKAAQRGQDFSQGNADTIQYDSIQDMVKAEFLNK